MEKWLTAGLGHKLSLDHLVPEERKSQEHSSHITDTGTRLGTVLGNLTITVSDDRNALYNKISVHTNINK